MTDTVLITGGAGFIGSHIVDVFVKYGKSVIVAFMRKRFRLAKCLLRIGF